MATRQSNRAVGTAFRNSVVLFLKEQGHTTARPNAPASISEAIQTPGDVDGLPVAIAVRSANVLDLSGLLSEAASAAEWSGKEYAVAIHTRRGYPLSEAYACMSLADFAELLHLIPELEPVTD